MPEAKLTSPPHDTQAAQLYRECCRLRNLLRQAGGLMAELAAGQLRVPRPEFEWRLREWDREATEALR